MKTIQRVAQLFGWAFVVVALGGAVVSGMSMEASVARAPRLVGLFPVNFVHNLVHLGFGIWGIRASRAAVAARRYAVFAGAIYVALAVVGLFFPDGFGLVPLGGNDIWLHAGVGVVLFAAGLLIPGAPPTVEPAPTRTVRPPAEASPHRDPPAVAGGGDPDREDTP